MLALPPEMIPMRVRVVRTTTIAINSSAVSTSSVKEWLRKVEKSSGRDISFRREMIFFEEDLCFPVQCWTKY